MSEIIYQGHASFRVKTNSGLVIYIDPYAGEGYTLPADVILVTHDHFDHNKIELVPQKSDCTIITNDNARESEDEYNTYEINDLTIEAVPAYNSHHPRDFGVGYILSFDGRQVYITGDTGNIEEAKQLAAREIDLVFVPTDGIYTMTLEEAKEFSYNVNAKFSVPVHTNPEVIFDPKVAMAYDGKDKILVSPGEPIYL